MSSTNGIGQLISHVSEGANAGMQEVANLSETMDVTSPADMSKMQLAMMQMSMAVQLQASVVKSFEDMVKSVLQRM